jgi:DNA-binding NarL/FixJ family response regulator
MADPLRVALIDDDIRICRSLRMLIEGSPGYDCVGDWSTVEAALADRSLGRAEVLLLDLELPGMDGDEGVELFMARFPSLIVLMFTAFDDDERVFASLCRGARGYLLKNTAPARLLEAIREAADGGSPMSPTIARKVVHLLGKTAPEPRRHPLTEREKELLALLADGHSYASSAADLGITINTVRNHIRSIYEKLQVHTQGEAVSKALRAGLI